jgi:hypothetical protein
VCRCDMRSVVVIECLFECPLGFAITAVPQPF